ncbi:MAG: rhomboid family intramembrane serine protease [Deltaproteobacteria bacterium]|nr:rhomboid family intramembrane serine protease [Deltaproteobacteria bacterium]
MYGLVPARYTIPQIASYSTTGQQLVSLITFMFLHSGFWHLLGNMWSLYIFGDNIEERLGHLRYLAFYMICGLASGLCHLVFNYNSTMPTIGASGAIAGVIGAYFILFPKAKILTLIPIFFIPYFIEIPAFFSRYLVCLSVPQCRRKPRPNGRHCMVGSHRRIYFRHNLFKTVSCSARRRRQRQAAEDDRKKEVLPPAGYPACRNGK